MKRLAILLVLTVAIEAKAQIYIPPGFIFGTPTAGAACTAGSGQVNATTGIAYLCQNSVWVAISSSASAPTRVFPVPGAAFAPVANIGGGLLAVTGVSGGSGFSGSGTIFLTGFNGCTGSMATVTLSGGAFASSVTTAIGSGCPAAPTSATCTSGTAVCTGSPVSITVTSTLGQVQVVSTAKIPGGTMTPTGRLAINIMTGACNGSATPQPGCAATNTGTCTLRAYLSASSAALTTAFSGATAASAHNGAWLISSVRNQNSLAAQQVDTLVTASGAVTSNVLISPTTFNTANDLYINVTLQNSVLTDTCFIDQMDIVNWP